MYLMNAVTIPALTPRLAEFLGIMSGDGNIYVGKRSTYRVSISLHSEKDRTYSSFVSELFTELFNKTFHVTCYTNKKLLSLRAYSKEIVYFLHETYSLPIGPKTHLDIPPQIRNSTLGLHFIRGFFDTDGCAYIRNTNGYQYPVLKLTTKCHSFGKQIATYLTQYSFRPNINVRKDGCADVILNGWKQLHRWNQLIGTSNKRNKIRARRDLNPQSAGISCHQS